MQLKREAYFLISFLFISSINVSAQDQKIADSLAKIYKLDTARRMVNWNCSEIWLLMNQGI